MADGLGSTSLIGQGSPCVMMGFSIVGLEAECFRMLLESFLHLAPVYSGHSPRL